ncbi:swr complex subunit [Coemansia nantahalensis]|nr:swr complex subunit [Coemansia nantahalensis]
MSLADLYKDGADLSGSGEESEEDFVPSEASDDGGDDSGSDDPSAEEAGEGDDDSASGRAQQKEQGDQEEREKQETHKRRIEAIAQEMLAPVGPRKAARTAGDEEPAPAADTPRVEPDDGASKEAADEPAGTGVAEPKRAPRRASKFSKIAEQVEKRRTAKGNTLDTARRAWAGFVAAEGIRDELDKANKDGYVERQQFLGRVDQRTYERSRGQGR